MIVKCYSYGSKCPCTRCDKECCIQQSDVDGTDTEKLCEKAKEYCEKTYLSRKGGAE